MFKSCIFVAIIAIASAGVIPLDEGYALGGYGGIALAAPKVIATHAVAVKAGATSYQNSNLLALHPTPVVTKAIAAPVVTKVATPIVTKVATPIVTKVAAPVAYATPAVHVVHVGEHYDDLGLGGLTYGYGKY